MVALKLDVNLIWEIKFGNPNVYYRRQILPILTMLLYQGGIFKSIKFSITTNDHHSASMFKIHITSRSDKYFNGNSILNN